MVIGWDGDRMGLYYTADLTPTKLTWRVINRNRLPHSDQIAPSQLREPELGNVRERDEGRVLLLSAREDGAQDGKQLARLVR